MKHVNLHIKYILLLFIAIIATACSSGSCDSSNNPDSQEVIMDSSNGGVANGATDVSLSPSIVLQFKQSMNASTVNSSTTILTDATNNQVIEIGQIVANNDNTKFYFSPVQQLQPGTKYIVSLTSEIKTATGTSIAPTSFSFTTTIDSDMVNPTVSIIEPGNGANNVLLVPNIQVKFSEAVQNVNTNTVTLRQGSPTGSIVATGNIIAGADNTYTFSPSSPLDENATYYVVLTNAITDMSGNALAPISFSFTTGNFNAPTVSMTTPSNNATNLPTTPNITIQFSEEVQNVNTNTITLHQGSATGSIVATGNIVAGANNTYTFSPESALNDNTTYYVVLTNGITDMSGNALAPISFSFTTGDFTAPTVSMTTPSNNATNLPTTPNITIQFSEEVQNVNTNTVTLRQGSPTGSIVATGNIIAGADNTYTFSPASALNDNTTYYVVLTNAITDMSGNALAPISFSFTTVAKAWQNVGNPGFSAGGAQYQSLAIAPDGTPYVAYRDLANGNRTTVMMFDGTSWVPVGAVGFSAGDAQYQSLAINESGTPYVAYRDLANGNRTTVMMFDGTSWVPVGVVGFSAGNSNYQSLAINKSGTLYVAYSDNFNTNKTTVMMYNGTSWVSVGAVGFSVAAAFYQSLAINESGTLYVAYRDGGNSNKTTVMMFNGTNWVPVGTVGFSAGVAAYQSLAINESGTPYVAYRDEFSASNKTTVMMFDGASWVDVGLPRFSTTGAFYQSLVIAPDGTPYVAQQTQSSTTVMMYDGASWVDVGLPRFSAGDAQYQSLAINESGIPYVAYRDQSDNDKTTVMNFK